MKLGGGGGTCPRCPPGSYAYVTFPSSSSPISFEDCLLLSSYSGSISTIWTTLLDTIVADFILITWNIAKRNLPAVCSPINCLLLSSTVVLNNHTSPQDGYFLLYVSPMAVHSQTIWHHKWHNLLLGPFFVLDLLSPHTPKLGITFSFPDWHSRENLQLAGLQDV